MIETKERIENNGDLGTIECDSDVIKQEKVKHEIIEESKKEAIDEIISNENLDEILAGHFRKIVELDMSLDEFKRICYEELTHKQADSLINAIKSFQSVLNEIIAKKIKDQDLVNEYINELKNYFDNLTDVTEQFEEIVDNNKASFNQNINDIIENTNLIGVPVPVKRENDPEENNIERHASSPRSESNCRELSHDEIKKFVDEYVEAIIKEENRKKEEKGKDNRRIGNAFFETPEEKRKKIVDDILGKLKVDNPEIRALVDEMVVKGPYRSAFGTPNIEQKVREAADIIKNSLLAA